MITKGDEYPIHQTPEPIAYSGTDRNFYDRFFFNGYSSSEDVFFSLAMGIYPHLNVKDAAFCITIDGTQHNLRASAHLNMERMDTSVGPIGVDIVTPLEEIRIYVEDNDSGIVADLTFTRRCVIVEEPRFTKRVGPRTMMDLTRMTQNGTWDGYIELKGRRVDVASEEFSGTRDRSWGVRNIGEPDAQPWIPQPEFQFFWMWAPINFPDYVVMFGINEDADGGRWHQNAMLIPTSGESEPLRFEELDVEYNYIPGTRHQRSLKLQFSSPVHGIAKIDMTSRFHYYMAGMGYGHPQWGHGRYRGNLEVAYDTTELEGADLTSPANRHIQATVDATLDYGKLKQKGSGVLEQWVAGPHYPSGLNDAEAMAK